MATRIIIPKARLSFPKVYEIGTYNGEPTKYEATALVPQEGSEALIAKLKAAIKEQLAAKYGDKIPSEFTKMTDGKLFGMSKELFIRDGDNSSYDGYAGMWSIKGTNKAQPKILDTDKTPLLESSGKIYGGCYVNMMIDVWIMDNQYGKRICANLLGLQYVAPGEPFGAGGAVPDDVVDEFDEVEGEGIDLDDF